MNSERPHRIDQYGVLKFYKGSTTYKILVFHIGQRYVTVHILLLKLVHVDSFLNIEIYSILLATVKVLVALYHNGPLLYK